MSCYDLYTNGDRDLCPDCINYLDLVPKSKPQSQMGILHYDCHGPTSLSEDDTSSVTTEDVVDEVEVEGQHCTHMSTNCVTDSIECHQRKKSKRYHSSCSVRGNIAAISVNPSETTNMDSANGAMMRNIMLEPSVELEFWKERLSELLDSLNSSEAEVSWCKVQLKLCQEKENHYVDALSKTTAQVEEERENVRDKEKKYEDALCKLRQKTALKYQRKISKLTSELQ